MQRASRRKHHYIYKITRQDGKYYIGMHSTDDLDDGYFGSGTLLATSIRKHGKEKHTKEILEHLPSREALKLRERELVNKEILDDKLCMNLKLGGEGGWDHVWANAQHRAIISGHMKRILTEKWISPEFRERICRAMSDENRRRHAAGTGYQLSFAGLNHSVAAKEKIGAANSVKAAGSSNSQYGTCWVCADGQAIKIKKEDLDSYLQRGFHRGRK